MGKRSLFWPASPFAPGVGGPYLESIHPPLRAGFDFQGLEIGFRYRGKLTLGGAEGNDDVRQG